LLELLIAPLMYDPLVDKRGVATQEFYTLIDQIVNAINDSPPLIGSGTPEGSEAASIGRWYVDTLASPADIYYKEAGDGNTGWIITS